MIPAAYKYPIAIGLALGVLVAAFAGGYRYRDATCVATSAKVETGQAKAQAKAVTQARTDDHASQQNAAMVEQVRIAAKATREADFKIIYRDVIRYVENNRDATGCALDADGLRIWRAANEGRAHYAEPRHSGGAAGGGAVPEGAASAH